MVMRLTAKQAVLVVRAFVQLEHPEAVEGDDYRIPDAKRFREWRRYLAPICHFLALSVVKLATRTQVAHGTTTKLGTSIFQTCFRCEFTQSDGRVLVVDVPLKFDMFPSFKAEVDSDHVAESLPSAANIATELHLKNTLAAVAVICAGQGANRAEASTLPGKDAQEQRPRFVPDKERQGRLAPASSTPYTSQQEPAHPTTTSSSTRIDVFDYEA
jgi:hypothetical protein